MSRRLELARAVLLQVSVSPGDAAAVSAGRQRIETTWRSAPLDEAPRHRKSPILTE
jgi:hypothetical protein